MMNPNAINEVRAVFACMGQPGSCTRCGGSGYRNEDKGWVVVPTAGGRVCFRCRGNGVEPVRKMTDPLRVRRAVIARFHGMIKAGEFEKARFSAERELGRSDPYLPVLVDVYERVLVVTHTSVQS